MTSGQEQGKMHAAPTRSAIYPLGAGHYNFLLQSFYVAINCPQIWWPTHFGRLIALMSIIFILATRRQLPECNSMGALQFIIVSPVSLRKRKRTPLLSIRRKILEDLWLADTENLASSASAIPAGNWKLHHT